MAANSFRRRCCCGLLAVIFFSCTATDRSLTYGQKLFSNPRQLSRGIKLETKPVSHDRLIKLANRAFVGVAERIDVKEEPIGAGSSAAVRTVNFRIEEVLFDDTGELKVGELYPVRSLVLGSREVKDGEKVCWFLAPNSSLGLTQPVGIDSGDFRFTTAGDVVNLKQNENLLNPEQVQDQATALGDSLPANANVDEFQQKLKTWATRAEGQPAGAPGVPIPFELLLARTREMHDQLKPEAPPIEKP
jgi:hypothetical protein